MSFRGQTVSEDLPDSWASAYHWSLEGGNLEEGMQELFRKKEGREGQISQPCLFGTRSLCLDPITVQLSWGVLGVSSAPGLSTFLFPSQAWAETSPTQCM